MRRVPLARKAGLPVNSSESELHFKAISNWAPFPSCGHAIGSPIDPAIDLSARFDPPFDPAVNGGEGAITVTRDPLVPPLVPNAIRSEPVRPALQNVWGRKAMATSVFGRPTVSFSHACQALGGNHHPILYFARCRGDSPRAAWRS